MDWVLRCDFNIYLKNLRNFEEIKSMNLNLNWKILKQTKAVKNYQKRFFLL